MIRKAKVFVGNIEAGILAELELGRQYSFDYSNGYFGLPVSLTMADSCKQYKYDNFPPFFDGLLPEGYQLEGLLKFGKMDRNDLFSQLIAVGNDLVGNITVKEVIE